MDEVWRTGDLIALGGAIVFMLLVLAFFVALSIAVVVEDLEKRKGKGKDRE